MLQVKSGDLWPLQSGVNRSLGAIDAPAPILFANDLDRVTVLLQLERAPVCWGGVSIAPEWLIMAYDEHSRRDAYTRNDARARGRQPSCERSIACGA